MKYLLLFLISLFNIIPTVCLSQYCNVVTTNVTITPTTTNQVTTSYTSGRRAFNFLATAGCTYYFETCGLSTADTYLRLYSTGTGGALLATGDDNCGLQSVITWTCTTNGTYSILMTNFSCATLTVATSLRYRITSCVSPFNPCSSITNISICGTNTNFTVGSGSGSYNPPSSSCGFSTPGQERIFTFTPTVTTTYTINQVSSFGWIDWFFKPVSSGCNGTGWTCVDDLSGAMTSVAFTLTAGVQYYIMCDPETTTGGTVQFSLSCPTPPPTNDNCINATTITLPYNSGVVSNLGSTNDNPSSFCGQMGSNLWYKVVGDGQEYIATTCDPSSNFDTEISVYSGYCGSMIEETCNDDDALCGSSGLRSTVTWCTVPDVEYFISVGYYTTGGGFGNFRLLVNNGIGCTSLPIELLTFTGEVYNDDILLEWTTASEYNNYYFFIERSWDGVTWERIKEIEASGFSTTTIDYLTIDENPKDGLNYYRLTQVDFDGQYETFDPISVNMITTKDCDYKFYNMSGQLIDIQTVPTGIYFKRCGEISTKFVKY